MTLAHIRSIIRRLFPRGIDQFMSNVEYEFRMYAPLVKGTLYLIDGRKHLYLGRDIGVEDEPPRFQFRDEDGQLVEYNLFHLTALEEAGLLRIGDKPVLWDTTSEQDS